MIPKRIQRKRIKGWRMPENTVYVGRPTPYGNPWAIGEWGPFDRKAPDAEGAVGLFRDMLCDDEMRLATKYPKDLRALRGKNLACWCPIISQNKYCPCHADVLLSIANEMPMDEVIRENTRWTKGKAL